MNQTEFELIQRAQAGDSAAFCVLVEQHARPVHRLALRFCGDKHDAEDLSQEVWLRAHKSLGTFRGESSFYTWLRQILIRTFLNRRSKIETVNFDDEIIFESSFDENINRKILVDRVREFLAELSPQQRLTFLLKYDEGMTYEEIAAALDCSSGTIKKSLFRTMTKLREKFRVNLAPSKQI